MYIYMYIYVYIYICIYICIYIYRSTIIGWCENIFFASAAKPRPTRCMGDEAVLLRRFTGGSKRKDAPYSVESCL